MNPKLQRRRPAPEWELLRCSALGTQQKSAVVTPAGLPESYTLRRGLRLCGRSVAVKRIGSGGLQVPLPDEYPKG